MTDDFLNSSYETDHNRVLVAHDKHPCLSTEQQSGFDLPRGHYFQLFVAEQLTRLRTSRIGNHTAR